MNRQTALDTLTRANFRITRAREAILGVMLEVGAERPFSAADIHRDPALGKSVDLVTIYRNLEVFEGVGLICRAEFNDDTVHFTLAHGDHAHHHHHVVCRGCRRVSALEDCGLKIPRAALRALGFVDIEHRLEFTGTCRSCRRV